MTDVRDAVGVEALEALVGQRRQLLVFSPTAHHPDFLWQLRVLAAARDGLLARDVGVLEVHGEEEGTLDGRPLTAEAAWRLREVHRAGMGGFLVVLVGQDGRETFRSNAPSHAGRFFGLLDARPRPQPALQEEPSP